MYTVTVHQFTSIMAKKEFHSSIFVFQTLAGNWSNWSQCTVAPFQGDRMAGMHELCNVAVTLPVKKPPGFSGSDCGNPSGFLRNGRRHPGFPQVHQRLAKGPWGLSKVLVPTIGRHWLR